MAIASSKFSSPQKILSLHSHEVQEGQLAAESPKPWVGLRFKVTFIIAGSFAILFLTQFAVVRTILLNNFGEAENDRALTNAARLQNALANEVSRLSESARDYSDWNETYQFVEGRNPNFMESQLYDDTFAHIKINTVAISNRAGKLLAQKGLDFYTNQPLPVPSTFLGHHLSSLKTVKSGQRVQGVLPSSSGVMLVTSYPVLSKTGTGQGNGVLSMGRYIDAQMIKKLSAAVQLPVTLYLHNSSDLPQELRAIAKNKFHNTTIAAQVLGENTIASYVQISDVRGKPALILKAENNRKIYTYGLNSLHYYFWSTLLIGLAFCALVLGLLERFILSRLSHLSEGVRAIGHQGTLSARIYLTGQDELTHLGKTINKTLDQLLAVQQALQNSKERYALAVMGANDGIWDWNLLTRTVYFSPRWQKILGYGDAALEPSLETWFEHVHPADLSDFKAAIDVHLQGMSSHLEHEHRIRQQDGTERWVMCRGSVVRDPQGTPTRMAGSLTDISDRKTAVHLLARQAEELARSNEELEQFAYIASHDLQEPLRKIEAFGDRLKHKYEHTLDEQGLNYLARMQNAAGRMRTLIQDLLAFSRITTQTHAFLPLCLSTLIQDVLSDLEVRIQETHAQVTLGPMPTLEADALQMRQLFQNLIGNALKFQQPGLSPQIIIESSLQPPLKNDGQCSADQSVTQSAAQPSTHASAQTTPFCCITVSDNGIGFDEKYLDRIFKVFQRLHGRNEYEGTGIGLAVCTKIVEHHGGTLTAKSTPGSGATFMIHLPLQQPKLEGEPTP
ncbi:MAG: ATP-binding protein [Thermosynechococcaceae cyanobacterium MS004]|nr:ATP-binding protein [Thermosynechococcaceae cyanobacterium MS004]